MARLLMDVQIEQKLLFQFLSDLEDHQNGLLNTSDTEAQERSTFYYSSTFSKMPTQR